MASNLLPVPQQLEIHDSQAAEKWKRFKRAWASYSLATGLNEKAQNVQVATLLTVIGEEAREVFATFSWAAVGDENKIDTVLQKFEQYCQPRLNVPFERYRFNRRMQEPGEPYDQYRTSLLKLAEGCSFGTITSEEILRDRLVFGIKDQQAREKLLRKANLTLADTDDICRSHEATLTQMKAVEEGSTLWTQRKNGLQTRPHPAGTCLEIADSVEGNMNLVSVKFALPSGGHVTSVESPIILQRSVVFNIHGWSR